MNTTTLTTTNPSPGGFLSDHHTVPRTCEALGVCQHPERECTGTCTLPPALPVLSEEDAKPLSLKETLWFWGTVVFFGIVTMVCVVGLAGYFYAKFRLR